MEVCIDAAELRKALAAIEAAEKNGFHHCLAVLKLAGGGPMLSDCRLRYSDLMERAHPTDGRLDWGRFQAVSSRHRFVGGKLEPLGNQAGHDHQWSDFTLSCLVEGCTASRPEVKKPAIPDLDYVLPSNDEARTEGT